MVKLIRQYNFLRRVLLIIIQKYVNIMYKILKLTCFYQNVKGLNSKLIYFRNLIISIGCNLLFSLKQK